MQTLLAVWLGLMGLVIGSFLNVVIARLPAGESIVHPRSRCPHCGHQLPWYENIPVFSWLALGGKCSACKSPISIRYPAIELLTALLFLGCLARFGWTYPLLPSLVLVGLVIPLVFIDAEHWILPFELTLPGIAIGIASAIPLGKDRLIGAVLGAGFGFLTFRLMEFIGWKVFKKEALGAGDKFLLAMLGAFLTHQALLGLILLSSLQGAVAGSIRLLLTGRAGPESASPEGALPPQTPPESNPEAEPPPLTMSWAHLEPGLSFWERLLRLPYAVFLQPIPDEPKDEQGEEVEWQPGATNLPFGPWIALAGLEILLLGPWLAQHFPLNGAAWMLFGPH